MCLLWRNVYSDLPIFLIFFVVVGGGDIQLHELFVYFGAMDFLTVEDKF